jgi:hypothetical protein
MKGKTEMSYSNWRGNGNNAAGAGNKGTTVLIVTHADVSDIMAIITTFDTREGRRSSVSVLEKDGSVGTHDKFVQRAYLQRIMPQVAVQTAEKALNDLANGGSTDEL